MRDKTTSPNGNIAKEKSRIHLAAVVLPLILFVVCSVVFVGNELLQNSRYYLRDAQNRQQKYVELLAEGLDALYSSGCDESAMNTYLQKHSSGSASSFFYLVRDGQVIFSQDQATTDSLGKYRDFTLFKSSYAEQKVLWSSAPFGDGQYEVGSVYSQSHLLKQAKVTKHTVYILLPLAVCTAVYFILVVMFAAFWADSDKKNRALEKKIVEDTLKIEELLAEKEPDEQLAEPVDSEKYRIYNRNVVVSLLKKSEDPALYPLSVLVIKIPNRSSFSYGKFYSLMSLIQDHLNSVQMIAETDQDEITVLMYRTPKKDAVTIRQECFEDIRRKNTFQELIMHTAVISTEDQVAESMLQYYENTEEKLNQKGMMTR